MTVEEAGQVITAPEATRWAAWERLNGPVLVHERIDVGLAYLTYMVAAAFGVKRQGGGQITLRDCLPEYLRDEVDGDSVSRGMEQLRLMALAKQQGVEGWGERRAHA